MIIESTFIWEDAKTILPPTNKFRSAPILFTMEDIVYSGYLEHSGYFISFHGDSIGLAPFLPENENFYQHWKDNLIELTFPIVSRWVYLAYTYPKLDLIKDRLIRFYQFYEYGEEEISQAIIQRAINYCTEIYQHNKLNFIPPSLNSKKGRLTLEWKSDKERLVQILLGEGNDYLTVNSSKFHHTFFPFDIYKVIEWLAWLDQ